jgi:DNA-binding MarR family transcriptional regulator
MDEKLIDLATSSLHRLLWVVRLDRLGTWSKLLRGMVQLDMHILKLIAERPAIILKEICDELNIPNSTLTSAINRLEKKGLLKRVISPRDRRSFGLELTPRGWEFKQEHDQVDRLITVKVLEALEDSAEAQTFIALLVKVCQQFEGNERKSS